MAEGLDGNTVVQTVDLYCNGKLTDVDRLLAAVGRSGVVHVGLDGTGVGAEKVREMNGVLAGNAVRRLKANDPELTEVEVELSDDDEPAEPAPAPQLSIEPVAKPKRQASAKQREHLARIRVKAAESRRQKTALRQPRPATARSTPHPTFSEGDVDRLLDRYKERRKAKKVVKTNPDSSEREQRPRQ